MRLLFLKQYDILMTQHKPTTNLILVLGVLINMTNTQQGYNKQEPEQEQSNWLYCTSQFNTETHRASPRNELSSSFWSCISILTAVMWSDDWGRD